MSRSTSRSSRPFGPLWGAGRSVPAWPSLLILCLVFLGSGCASREAVQKERVQVEDRFVFRVYNQALQPLEGARIQVSLEAGRSLSPLPLATDREGRAVLRVRAQESGLVERVDSGDHLVRYRSTVIYRIESPGRLPRWGRAELTDSLEEFSRPSFSSILNTKPKNKTLPIRQVLYRVEDFFEPRAWEDPLARTVAAGLDQLWRAWSFSGRLERLRPMLSAWAVVRTGKGPYLKLGFELEDALEYLEDSAVHLVFQSELIPVLDELAALYAPFAAGWDITFNLAYRPQGDPHAMPVVKPLRLVFSEELRTDLLTRSGGLNWLIPRAERCTLDNKPWDPVATLARQDARHEYIWRMVPLFFVPGRGQESQTAEIKDTTEAPLPVSPGPF